MKLKDIVRESRETYKGDMSGIPVVGLEHLIPEEICFSEYEMCSDKTFTKAFHKGQVLFGRRRAYQKKAAVAHVDGVCSGDIMVLEAIPGKVEPSLLPFIIQNDRFFDYAIQHSEGGLSPRVKWNAIANYEFALPSIEEQKVLAEKLWAAYKVKESYRQLLSTTDEMLKAKFQEMFGDAEQVSINEFVDTIWGTSPASEFYNESGIGMPFYQGKTEFGDIYIGEPITYCTAPIRTAKAHSILMSVRAPVGDVNIATEDCCIGRGLASITPKEGKSTLMFIFYAIRNKADEIARLGTGSTIKAINRESYAKIKLPVSSINDQQHFAEIATQAEATKTSLRASIEAIDRVIRSLINQ